jgi:hypothetical protein
MKGVFAIRWLAIAVLATCGCGQTAAARRDSGDGGSASGGQSSSPAGNDSGGSAGTAGMATPPCPEVVTPHVGANAALELETALFFEGNAVSPGQPNTLATGGVLTPLNLRFYISDVALLREDGTSAPADLVDAMGAVKPYGLQLINTDDDNAMSLRLLGPAGSYTGIRFTFGVDDSCNSGSSERKPPLSATSGMTWPPPFGYLFFRYEGMYVAAAGETTTPPSAIHMGGLPGSMMAPVVTAKGSVTLSQANATHATLRLMLDQVFAATRTTTDLGDFVGPPGNEVEAGERLRRAAPELPLFVLVP